MYRLFERTHTVPEHGRYVARVCDADSLVHAVPHVTSREGACLQSITIRPTAAFHRMRTGVHLIAVAVAVAAVREVQAWSTSADGACWHQLTRTETVSCCCHCHVPGWRQRLILYQPDIEKFNNNTHV